MFPSTSMPLRSPPLSDEDESLPEGNSDEPLQHLEFITEEFHANDLAILRMRLTSFDY